LTQRTPQVAEHGAAATSSTPVKGKRITHTIEKGLQIMESKLKKKRPEGSVEVSDIGHAFVFWNVMAFCIGKGWACSLCKFELQLFFWIDFGVFKKLDTFGLAYENWTGLVYGVEMHGFGMFGQIW
jgi:hypothetical protein